jgi:mRNA-degrading endonuclease toxin of MazEF toxin-antitoxin module
MTEQLRAVSTDRRGRRLGRVDNAALTKISRYLHLFIA